MASYMVEEVDLLLVNVVRQLYVNAPNPPVVGKSQGEVASRLLRLPSTDLAARSRRRHGSQHLAPAEQVQECKESVVPVVIPGDSVQVRSHQPGLGIGPSSFPKRLDKLGRVILF